jgi:photosystem II stability/assembly factor-like uncharacterized protein
VTIAVSPNGRNHYDSQTPSDQVLVATFQGIAVLERDGAGAPWREAGRTLEGKHIASIVVEPRSGAIFAGVHDGGLWRSTDGGKTWGRSDNGIEFDNIYGLNYVEAGDELRLYAGTDPAHIYVSTNLGESWTELPSLRDVPGVENWTFPAPPHFGHVKNIEFDPRDPNTIYVAVEVGGAFKSTDAGKTWSQMPGVYEDVHRMMISPTHPDTLYMTTGHDLYQSTNAGGTWEILPMPEQRIGYPDALILLPDQPELMFTAGGRYNPGQWRKNPDADATIARSRDGGRSWDFLTNGLPSYMKANIEAVTVNTYPGGFALYAATTDGDVFASDDAGDTWTTIARQLPPISKKGHTMLRPDLAAAH